MRIIIIRHGEAFPPSEKYTEANRPLTEIGRSDTKKVGEYYSGCNVVFDAIWTSPYVRAIQTKDNIFGDRSNKNVRIIDELKPNGNPTAVLKLLTSEFAPQTILGIVGHQPQIGRILSMMFGSREDVFDIQPATSIEAIMLKANQDRYHFKLIRFIHADHIP